MSDNEADAWEMAKETAETVREQWTGQLRIVSLGVITEVLDGQNVRALEIVQGGSARELLDVTLLYPSTPYHESVTVPKRGDMLLLLFLRRHNSAMFRFYTEPEDAIITDRHAAGYDRRSAVGILMSPPRPVALSRVRHSKTGTDVQSGAPFSAAFTDSVTVTFDGAEGEAAVDLLFDSGFHFSRTHRGPVTEAYGSPAGGPETDDVDAPVNITYGPKAPLDVASESSVSVSVKEALTVLSEDAVSVTSESGVAVEAGKALSAISKEAVTVKVDGQGKLEIGNSAATLGAMIGDLLSALDSFANPAVFSGNPYTAHLAAPVTALKTSLAQVGAQWRQVFS